jgi:hypothetical protein
VEVFQCRRDVNRSNIGATVTLLVLITAITQQDADASVKVVGAIPKDYWGEWTTGIEPCKSGDIEILVLSAKAPSYAADNSIGSRVEGSSFSGLLTR